MVNKKQPLIKESAGAAADISRGKQAEDALRESEERVSYVLENVQDAVWSADLTGQYEFLSPLMAHIYGRPLEEMINNPAFWKEAVYPEDQAAARASDEALKRDGHIELEYRIVHPDGTVRWILDRKTLVWDAHGESARIAGIISDVTERKRVEEALKESEEKFSKAFKSNPTPMAISTLADGRYIDVNASFLRLTGYSREEVIDHSSIELGIFTEKGSRTRMLEMMRDQGKIHNSEYEFCMKAGEMRLGLLSVETIRIGGQQCFLSILNDITERKVAEEKLAESARKLAARNEELRSALADKEVLLKEVHHRVKNNLMVISSLLNLQMRRTTDQEARESLRESDTRIMSMAMIHEQVLRSGEYAAIDSTSYINDLVSNIRNSLSPYDKDVRLTVDVQPGIIIGLNQAVILGMIINEIVSNSFKHAFQDCEKPEISIACRSSEDQVQLSIRDNGAGMPEGTGIGNPSSLGLELVNTLVKQMKGTMKYERAEGSKFTIMFSNQPESNEEAK